MCNGCKEEIVIMTTESWLAFLEHFPCAWRASNSFRCIVSLNMHKIIGPTVQMGKLKYSEAENFPKRRSHKWQNQDLNRCQGHLEEGFACHRKTARLSLTSKEGASKGYHMVLALDSHILQGETDVDRGLESLHRPWQVLGHRDRHRGVCMPLVQNKVKLNIHLTNWWRLLQAGTIWAEPGGKRGNSGWHHSTGEGTQAGNYRCVWGGSIWSSLKPQSEALQEQHIFHWEPVCDQRTGFGTEVAAAGGAPQTLERVALHCLRWWKWNLCKKPLHTCWEVSKCLTAVKLSTWAPKKVNLAREWADGP